MFYAKDMPHVPVSGWGRCDDQDCPGKKARQRAFGYLADHHDNTRATMMTELEDGWVRNGREKIVLPLDADGSR